MARLPFFFYRYLTSRFLSSIITNAFEIYFLWDIVVTYKSVFLAGLIPTIALSSSLLAAIPIGHLIDRHNSTALGMISSIILFIGVAVLLLGQSVPEVYSATVFVSIGVMMKGDTISATTKKHLSQEMFMSANQYLQGASYASALIGTVFGGASIIYLQHYFVLILLAMGIVSLLLSFPIAENAISGERKTAKSELASSFGFLKKIGGFLAVGFVLNGLIVCLDVYSSGLFHLVLKTSPVYYTLFVAFISIGGIIGAFVSGHVQRFINTPYRLAFLVLLYAPAILFVGISKSPIGDIVDSCMIGFLLPIINIPLSVNLMKVIPRSIYGKVMAFLKVFLGGATPAMAAVFSFVAIFLQVDLIFIIIGIIMFPVCALAFFVYPKFFALANDEKSDSESTS